MPSSPPPFDVRTTPVQQRGQDRVDQLLDAAARIVDREGTFGLTTSAVAEESGSSVGVVYRYFPNADAVILALAERNLQRYFALVMSRIEVIEASDWRGMLELLVRSYADMARDEPGLRVVRFGDVVMLKFANQPLHSAERLSDWIIERLVERHGFVRTDDFVFAARVAVTVTDALTRQAFLHSPKQADARFTGAATSLAEQLLAPFAPDAAAAP